MFSFTTVWSWVRGLFTANRTKAFVDLLDLISDVADIALPIVADIDEKLKPAIDSAKKSDTPVAAAIESFVRSLGFTDADELFDFELTAALPKADLYLNVALWVLRSRNMSSTTSQLRAAIELAYNIYKVQRG